MAVKTITIDMDAYELLSRYKKPKQSFSQVIKEHFGRQRTVRHFQAALRQIALSESTLDAIEQQARARRASRARAASL